MRESETGPWVEYKDVRQLQKIRNAAMALLICLDRNRPDQTLMAMALLREALEPIEAEKEIP